MSSKLEALKQWVAEVARITQPERIHWCDGSEVENTALIEMMLGTSLVDPATIPPDGDDFDPVLASRGARLRAKRAH